MGKKITLKRYICHKCGYVGNFPSSESRDCPKCGAPYMIPGDTVKGKKLIEEQEIGPGEPKKRSYKHYWIALWIMSIVIALALAFYFFTGLRPSQNVFFTKAKMKLPSEKIDLEKKKLSYIVITEPADLYRDDFKTKWPIEKIPRGTKLEMLDDHVWQYSPSDPEIVFYKVEYKDLSGWVIEDQCELIAQ